MNIPAGSTIKEFCPKCHKENNGVVNNKQKAEFSCACGHTWSYYLRARPTKQKGFTPDWYRAYLKKQNNP